MEHHLDISIRPEQPADIEEITNLTQVAFAPMSYASHTEQFIISALRRSGQLSVSLVAVETGTLRGHIAASPVSISSGATGWHGLGPLSVDPARQRRGIGTRLMQAALAALRQQHAQGCVLLGDPAYYGRFGFKPELGLVLPDVPPAYFQALSFTGEVPMGTVHFQEAFRATT